MVPFFVQVVAVVLVVALGAGARAMPSDELANRRPLSRNDQVGERQKRQRFQPRFPSQFDEHRVATFEARDQTSRMDVVKSIDDILSSPYDGPPLLSLEPLLARNSIRRLTRDSSNFRPEHSFHQEFPRRSPFFSNHFSSEFDFQSSPSIQYVRKPVRPLKKQFQSSSHISSLESTRHQGSQRPFETSFSSEFPRLAPIPSSSSFTAPEKNPSSDYHDGFPKGHSDFEFGRRTQPLDHRGHLRKRRDVVHSSQHELLPTFSDDTRTPKTADDDFSTRFPSSYKELLGQTSELASRTDDTFFPRDPLDTNYKNAHSRIKRDIPPSYRRRPFIPPAFVPGPSPPARILKPYNVVPPPPRFVRKSRYPSSFRFRPTPRRKNARLNLPFIRARRSLSDSPLGSSADTQGFIASKPSNFPDFESIGGFGPMKDVEQKESNFIPNFQFPSVDIPDIREEQPQLGPENFPSYQVSPPPAIRGEVTATESKTDLKQGSEERKREFVPLPKRVSSLTQPGHIIPHENSPNVKNIEETFSIATPFAQKFDPSGNSHLSSGLQKFIPQVHLPLNSDGGKVNENLAVHNSFVHHSKDGTTTKKSPFHSIGNTVSQSDISQGQRHNVAILSSPFVNNRERNIRPHANEYLQNNYKSITHIPYRETLDKIISKTNNSRLQIRSQNPNHSSPSNSYQLNENLSKIFQSPPIKVNTQNTPNQPHRQILTNLGTGRLRLPFNNHGVPLKPEQPGFIPSTYRPLLNTNIQSLPHILRLPTTPSNAEVTNNKDSEPHVNFYVLSSKNNPGSPPDLIKIGTNRGQSQGQTISSPKPFPVASTQFLRAVNFSKPQSSSFQRNQLSIAQEEINHEPVLNFNNNRPAGVGQNQVIPSSLNRISRQIENKSSILPATSVKNGHLVSIVKESTPPFNPTQSFMKGNAVNRQKKTVGKFINKNDIQINNNLPISTADQTPLNLKSKFSSLKVLNTTPSPQIITNSPLKHLSESRTVDSNSLSNQSTHFDQRFTIVKLNKLSHEVIPSNEESNTLANGDFGKKSNGSPPPNSPQHSLLKREEVLSSKHHSNAPLRPSPPTSHLLHQNTAFNQAKEGKESFKHDTNLDRNLGASRPENTFPIESIKDTERGFSSLPDFQNNYSEIFNSKKTNRNKDNFEFPIFNKVSTTSPQNLLLTTSNTLSEAKLSKTLNPENNAREIHISSPVLSGEQNIIEHVDKKQPDDLNKLRHDVSKQPPKRAVVLSAHVTNQNITHVNTAHKKELHKQSQTFDHLSHGNGKPQSIPNKPQGTSHFHNVHHTDNDQRIRNNVFVHPHTRTEEDLSFHGNRFLLRAPNPSQKPQRRGILRPIVDFVKKVKDETLAATSETIKDKESKRKPAEVLGESRHHTTVARKGAPPPESQVSLSRVTRQFPSFPYFDLGERRERAESNDNRQARDSFLSRDVLHQHPAQLQMRHREDVILPQSQRFFPSFNPRSPQRKSHSSQTFFPSGTFPGARGNNPTTFANRRPSFRSHGGHEAVHSPKFAFASNKFKEYGPVDNSILGSGNFEVIKGGTFYDNDDPHLNHNPYDPYLDNSYVVFPSGNPHSHNHVDDFFSNFRDFSEFANRRSGTVHQFDIDDGYLEPGFASEHVAHISALGMEDMMTSESRTSLSERPPIVVIQPPPNVTKTYEIGPSKIVILINKKKQPEPEEKPTKQSKSKKLIFKNKKITKSKKNLKDKRPKNIQDLLEEIDPFPTFSATGKGPLVEEDPLIATF